MDRLGKAFAACRPAVEFASTTTTPEDNLKAAQRMRAECNDTLQDAVASQVQLADMMVAFAKFRAEQQHNAVVGEVRSVLTLAVMFALATIGAGAAVYHFIRPGKS